MPSRIKKRIEYWLWHNKPRIYNLPEVIFIKWRDNEYYIEKFSRRGLL